ncbi:hypothetical protein [Roseateles sp.]|uniref:hypothetical protein n=1 Tax=Roseateles sp. TaxID=1971397 RepID=UPI0039280185
MQRRLAMLGLALGARAALAKVTQVLKVGPREAHRTLASAAKAATDGCLIEVEAGDYLADVATWPQHELTLRAVGGRVRLIASGAHAQGKGIFVTRGQRQRIEGLDFIGARVPDRNGAGIRLEAGSLTLVDCRFEDNENGVLTSNDPAVELDLIDCDFGRIAMGTGQTHQCYVGAIARLGVTGCHFHSGLMGHLLKSRARVNQVLYSRLIDGIGGRASYELEFPNGGQNLVMGNLIGQSSTSENPHLISVGAEGLRGGTHALWLVHNTCIDDRPGGGIWLRAASGLTDVHVANNLFVGRRAFEPAASWDAHHNHQPDWDEFVRANRDDWRLKPESRLRGKVAPAGPMALDGRRIELLPTRQYAHPARSVALTQPVVWPGALQG